MPIFIGRNAKGEVEVRKYEVGKHPPADFLTPEQLLTKVERLELMLITAQHRSGSALPDFLRGLSSDRRNASSY